MTADSKRSRHGRHHSALVDGRTQLFAALAGSEAADEGPTV